MVRTSHHEASHFPSIPQFHSVFLRRRYGHIASEKLEKILAACQDFESWLNELQQKQEAMPKYQKPILTCTEMEKRRRDQVCYLFFVKKRRRMNMANMTNM